jgi:hypothetical protein
MDRISSAMNPPEDSNLAIATEGSSILVPAGAREMIFDVSKWDFTWTISEGGHAGSAGFRFAIFSLIIVEHTLANQTMATEITLQFTWSTHVDVSSYVPSLKIMDSQKNLLYPPISFKSFSFDCSPYSGVYRDTFALRANDFDLVRYVGTNWTSVRAPWCAG